MQRHIDWGNPSSPHHLNIIHNETTCLTLFGVFYLEKQLFSSIWITMDKPETIEELEMNLIYK